MNRHGNKLNGKQARRRRRDAISDAEGEPMRATGPRGWVTDQEDLRATIQRWDRKLQPDSREFNAAVVMLGALYVGSHNLSQLSRLTGVPYNQVQEFAAALRYAGIWSDTGDTHASWGLRSGEMHFWIDVGIACGF